jgi:co-chaperonin GroES (HSP10)
MNKIDVDTATQLPKPKGFKILCAIPEIETSYNGGLAKADSTIRVEEQTTVILFVVAMGDMCYADKTKFPTEPWCKVGDFILTRPYAGTRVIIHEKEFRIINDDTVEAVVDDPRGYRRA